MEAHCGFERALALEDVARPLMDFQMPPWVTLDTCGLAGGGWDDATCDTDFSAQNTWRDGSSQPGSPEVPVPSRASSLDVVNHVLQEEDDDEEMQEMLREQEEMIAKERALTGQIAEKKRLEARRSSQEAKNLAEQLQHMRIEQEDMIRLRQAVDREGGRKSVFVKFRPFSGPASVSAKAYIKAAPAQALSSVDTDTLRDSSSRSAFLHPHILRPLTAPSPLRHKQKAYPQPRRLRAKTLTRLTRTRACGDFQGLCIMLCVLSATLPG